MQTCGSLVFLTYSIPIHVKIHVFAILLERPANGTGKGGTLGTGAGYRPGILHDIVFLSDQNSASQVTGYLVKFGGRLF